MTAAVWTLRQPVAGVQQPDAVSDTAQHPSGTRMNAVNAGVEWRLIYGRAGAALAANAAASFDIATGLFTAGTASPVDGNMIAAIALNQYGWMKITSET